MPLVTVPSPSGIDVRVSKLQALLYSHLISSWGGTGLTSQRFSVFGRTYRNSTQDGYLPQLFLSYMDYNADMFHDDKLDALIWFALNDETRVNGQMHTYNMSMYVFCNLNKVKPDNVYQRMDESVVMDVSRLLMPKPYGFVHTDTERDVDHVLQAYSGYRKRMAEVNNNHSDKLCFRMDMYVNISVLDDCDFSTAIPDSSTMPGYIRVNIVTVPDPSVKQRLTNGQYIPLEYAPGATFTIPFLADRDILPNVLLDNNNIDGMPFDPVTGTFTPDGGTFDGQKLLIQYY